MFAIFTKYVSVLLLPSIHEITIFVETVLLVISSILVVHSVHTTITLATCYPILDENQELTSHGSEEICIFDGRRSSKTKNCSIGSIYF
jgi:hypothetical protein